MRAEEVQSIKLKLFLKKMMPYYEIHPVAIKNAHFFLRQFSDDAHDFASALRVMKSPGQVEYLKVILEKASAVPKTVIWEFNGSASLVSRVTDIGFWDTTHHISRYDYRLSRDFC